MLEITLNGVLEEDVICRLFHYIFEGSTGSWYFSLPTGSIIDWDTFEDPFKKKMGMIEQFPLLLMTYQILNLPKWENRGF